MSIICATNFSEQSRAACDGAAALARLRSARLWLVHAFTGEVAHGRLREDLRGVLEAQLAREAERLRAKDIDVETALLEGALEATIWDFATRNDGELIVAASHRRETAFGGMGGHLDRLAATSSLPLLVIKDSLPYEQWARGDRRLKVVLAVDRSASFAAARDWLSALERFGRLEVVAAHVFYPFAEAERLGVRTTASDQELAPQITESLMGEIADLVGARSDAGTPPRVHLQPGLGRIADHLISVAVDEDADLVVVGTRHRGGASRLWSVSHHTLRLAPMSVACVPNTVASAPADLPIPRYRTVLVTTDLSEMANAAVAHAFGAVEPGGVVHLLHVVDPKATTDRAGLERLLKQQIPRESRAQAKLAKLEIVAAADPATAIIQAAERANADLICMSTHGRSGVMRAMFGSVSAQVIERCRRPLLILRPPR